MVTEEQKERILKSVGCLQSYATDDKLHWFWPDGKLMSPTDENRMPVFDLNLLNEILESRLKELWGERFSITIRHYEDVAFKLPQEKQWHITLAKWELDPPGYEKGFAGFVIRIGAFGDTQAEALQKALLKLAEAKNVRQTS